MAISVRKRYVAISTFDYTGIEGEMITATEDEIRDYIKDNPLPDLSYFKEDIIRDFSRTTGMLVFPDDITDNMARWLEDLISSLL